MSLRLETREIEINGVTYPLRCNMAVLERLQDGPGQGQIGNLMKQDIYQSVFDIAKAMLDDACEDNPELPEVSMKQLKKTFNPADLASHGVLILFTKALDVAQILPEDALKAVAQEAKTGEELPENSGN